MKSYLKHQGLPIVQPNPGPHADGVVGSLSSPTMESLDKQLHELLVKQYAAGEEKASTPSPQSASIFA